MSDYRLKGASGAVANQYFPLADRILIGQGKDCDISIEKEGVDLQHAEVLELDGSVILRNLGSPGTTLLNGEPVEQASLVSGDEIRVANCRWVLQAPGLRPQKVLTPDAVEQSRNWLPWLMVVGLLAVAAFAWQRGMLPF